MIKKMKAYFKNWDTARIIKMVAGIVFLAGYFSVKETIYLFGSLFFAIQALFNIGCPGGSCATNITKGEEKEIKVDQYKPNKSKSDV